MFVPDSHYTSKNLISFGEMKTETASWIQFTFISSGHLALFLEHPGRRTDHSCRRRQCKIPQIPSVPCGEHSFQSVRYDSYKHQSHSSLPQLGSVHTHLKMSAILSKVSSMVASEYKVEGFIIVGCK